MLKLTEFTTQDWLKLEPLNIAFKQFRNDTWLNYYCKKHPAELKLFLQENSHLANQNIALVVAFEQPWALGWLLKMAKKNLPNVTVLVFDNSRNLEARAKIKQVCAQNQAPYLALPMNNTKHVNRSHGMAMSWIYNNVVTAIKPQIFSFLDHDLIPISAVDFNEKLGNQACYGRYNKGKFNYWSLWAGYCIFNYAMVKNKALNFLYDFSCKLDTGGRNWPHIYQAIDANQYRHAYRNNVMIKLPNQYEPRQVEILDERWVHMGGISYNDGFKDKFAFFEAMDEALEKVPDWRTLIVS